jgi:hypothetical protein
MQMTFADDSLPLWNFFHHNVDPNGWGYGMGKMGTGFWGNVLNN